MQCSRTWRPRLARGLLAGAAALCGLWSGQGLAAELPETAADCAARAGFVLRINLSSGVYTERAIASAPLAIEIPVGLDGNQHADCLRREGFDPAAEMAAPLERFQDCRDSARRQGTVRIAKAESIAVGGQIDVEAYRSCLASDIEVQVELPKAD